jgi:hypothetical protein
MVPFVLSLTVQPDLASDHKTRASLRILLCAAQHLLTEINGFLIWLAISDA